MKNGTFNSIQLTGPANGDFLGVVGDCIESIFKRIAILNDSEEVVYAIQLAIHETCTNIVDHAYTTEQEGEICLNFSIGTEPFQLIVDVEDQGNTFDPALVSEPNSENLQVRGYGLFLIQKLMDKAVYTSTDAGNRWRLIKNLTI